ncbi:hypothetical protein BSKO_03481 [Bryopsis sp. KO-2023]|nr:hypothetical protein BSKO_03481 [Bryopsis sp. KO-2023]
MDLVRIDLRDRPARSRRRRRRASGAANENEWSERSAAVSVCLVVACLISGAGLAWYGDFRAPKQSIIDVFDQAITQWNQEFAAQFNNTEWRLTINGTVLQLSKSQRLIKQMADGEPAYSLDFSVQGLNGLMFPSLLSDPDDCTKKGNNASSRTSPDSPCTALKTHQSPHKRPQAEKAHLDSMHLELSTGDTRIPLGNVSFFKRRDMKSHNWKACVYRDSGRWLNGLCEVYSFVDTICVKVKQHHGEWRLDDGFGNFGCDPHNHWDVQHWKKLKLSKGNSTAPVYLPPDISTKPVFSVRSAFDPDIIARNLTDRMVKEVEPKVEEWAAGIILLFIGFVGSIPTITVAWPVLSKKFCSKRRLRYTRYRSDDEEMR